MTTPPRESRRAFLKKSAVATAVFVVADFAALAAGATKNISPVGKAVSSGELPWYRRALRWGQTNITEIDPQRYDIAWWRQHWKRTHFFFQAEDGIRDFCLSRGLGDVYKRQEVEFVALAKREELLYRPGSGVP